LKLGDYVTFYLFGDVHYSRANGCHNINTIGLTPDGKDLNEESIKSNRMKTIDLTAAFYLLLRYNNIMKRPTDMFMEIPFNTVDTRLPTTEEVKKIGWIKDATKLFINSDDFRPNCSVNYADIRQNDAKGTLDIITQISSRELPNAIKFSDKETISLFEIIKVIFKYYVELFDALTRIDSFDNLRIIIDKVGNLPKTMVRDRCLSSLRGMLTSDFIVVNGKKYYCHKIAKELEELRQFNKRAREIADANLAYIKKKYLKLKADLDQSNMLEEVTTNIMNYSTLDEVVRIVFNSYLASVTDSFSSMSMWFMDIYLITLSFKYRSPNKIIFAGNYHIRRYVDLLVKVHGCKHVVGVDTYHSYYDSTKKDEVLVYKRCIDIPELPKYIDFADMKNTIYRR
jgi:hypothetical protein